MQQPNTVRDELPQTLETDPEITKRSDLSYKRLNLLVLSLVNSQELCHGAGLRAHHLLRHLEQAHRITFLCAEDFPVPASARKGPAHRLYSMLNLHNPYPLQLEFQQAARRTIASGEFDAIVLFGTEMLQYLPLECPIPMLADLVDEPVLATLRELHLLRGWEFLTTLKHALSVAIYERRLCRQVTSCMVVSEENARWFSRVVPSVQVAVIPNGVDTGFFRPQGLPVQQGEIVFSGNMGFPPNIAACLHFAERIFPRIAAAYPGAHWTIVGRDPHPSIAALGTLPGISVTGFVPDIRPYIERAAVIVSPLISGGGIKNKILEAWALHKAVVATPLGSAGVEARDEVNLLIAKDVPSFIEKTLRLLREPSAAQSLGAAGYSTVLTSYRWEKQAAEMEQLLQAAVRQSISHDPHAVAGISI
jgi:glycosyltransferase involved in cell wall biosynthesis